MENPKYTKAKKELEETGITIMKVFGNSMTPLIESGSLLTFQKEKDYIIGDIVFCRCRGRIIDAHLITKKDQNKGYLIANNHGYENGWTKKIFGRVVEIKFPRS